MRGVSGRWVYRSFLNNQAVDTDFRALEFGRATLQLLNTDGKISGTIGGPQWQLEVEGDFDEVTKAFSWSAKGIVGGQLWHYDYKGVFAYHWENGVNQIPSIVGTVIRTIAHGNAPAGFTASFIAVSAD